MASHKQVFAFGPPDHHLAVCVLAKFSPLT